jgi:hypothetical protein
VRAGGEGGFPGEGREGGEEPSVLIRAAVASEAFPAVRRDCKGEGGNNRAR